MDEARLGEIRGRLDRPHTRDALAPLVTASELRALLDALDAAEREHAADCEDLARIGRLVGCDSLVGVEIHAAVEHELLERDAARDAAERAERERDDARAEVETMRAEAGLMREKLAAHARHTDAAVDGVRAMLPAALKIAREEGAAAMRERILDELRYITADDERAIRALPLDAPGGA
jgi:hypothetical protein